MDAQSKAKTGANAVAYAALVLAGLLFGNIILNRYFKRVDFTQDRIYTLSQPSKDLVAKLPDRLTVKAFISSDLQPPFSQTAQYMRDLLDEYANASKGKMKWEAIDPGSDAKLEEEATKLKVPKMRRGRVSSNKVEIGASYLGVAFQYQGNIESIPEVNSPEGLEYQMTSIIKMLTVKKKKIAFASSEGELSPSGGGDPRMGGGGGGLQTIKQFMNDYETVDVKLNTGAKPIADDVDALVIAGPKQPMSERAKFVVDQFLMKGKSVAFLVDGMLIQAAGGGMQFPGQADQPKLGQKNPAELDDLLSAYSFKLRDDMIQEPRLNVPGPIALQGQLFLANYPTFVAVTQMAPSSPVTDHVKAVVLPFPSSLERTPDAKDKQPGLSVEALASTSPEAWRQSGFFLFNPQPNQQIKQGDEHGPFVLAFAASGKLKSFFAGRPYPNEKGEKVQPPAPNTSLAPGEERPLDESVGPVRMVIVGDSEFASDEYLRFGRQIPAYSGNLLFMMNILDWMAQDDTLSPIRAKGMTSRPIAVASESTPKVVKLANVVGVPLLFIVFGVARWQLRTARRRNAKL